MQDKENFSNVNSSINNSKMTSEARQSPALSEGDVDRFSDEISEETCVCPLKAKIDTLKCSSDARKPDQS